MAHMTTGADDGEGEAFTKTGIGEGVKLNN